MQFSSVDTIWVLLAAILVFFMQAGFTMVEIGFTRSKNTGNLVMKNLLDFSLGSLAFWAVGFGLMHGAGGNSFIGGLDLFIRGDYSVEGSFPSQAFIIFQTVFCATAATIISGAMAERTKFSAYIFYSICMSMIVYPVSGHWIWGGGWLAERGFHDFAGSTAVHMVGGVAALVGAWMLGPRIGKYDRNGKANAIPGQSLAMGSLGVFILWFAWFGFNGGSTTAATSNESLVSMSSVIFNTNLSASAGAAVCMILTWMKYGKPDVSMTLNGALAGLVGITAGCDQVSPVGAALIGALSGIALVYVIEFVDKVLRIDDPLGTFAVHGFCGALGTILTGCFSVVPDSLGLFYGGGFTYVGIQVLGVVAVAVWVAVSMGIVYYVAEKLIGLRVSPAEEIAGLDMEEHGIPVSYPGLSTSGRLTSVLYKNSDAAEVGKAAAATTEALFKDGDISVDSPGPRDTTMKRKMTMISVITRPEKFGELKGAMHAIGITGMTVSKVMGCGVQQGISEYYRGVEIASNMLPKIRVDIVVSKVPVRLVIETAKQVLGTGHIGDGKLFTWNIENAVKVRTGEEGFDALQYSS
ncbi:MAG: ammonium transporter [Planctomycetaceae bacterium]|nr:ammonium transporter [Planctomycetaceae bacterium]